MSELGKVTEEQRRRAVVYVRQSSVGQVERNVESAAREYALRERAVELGWPAGSVAVVDEDPGRSVCEQRRPARIPGAGCRGRGSVVSGLSWRLRPRGWRGARRTGIGCWNLYALTGTLIADADGVYSAADFNDRLLLGLKGTMSEAELQFIRARLVGGLRHKAARGRAASAAAGRT